MGKRHRNDERRIVHAEGRSSRVTVRSNPRAMLSNETESQSVSSPLRSSGGVQGRHGVTGTGPLRQALCHGSYPLFQALTKDTIAEATSAALKTYTQFQNGTSVLPTRNAPRSAPQATSKILLKSDPPFKLSLRRLDRTVCGPGSRHEAHRQSCNRGIRICGQPRRIRRRSC